MDGLLLLIGFDIFLQYWGYFIEEDLQYVLYGRNFVEEVYILEMMIEEDMESLGKLKVDKDFKMVLQINYIKLFLMNY